MKRLLVLLAAAAFAEEPPAEWVAQFDCASAEFESKATKRLERDAWTQWKVEFPSPVKSETAENNTVHGHFLEPANNESRAAVIVLPIWKGGGPELELLVARRLAADGIAAFVMALPYQFERAPKGTRSGDLTVSADLERNRESLVQAVKDAKRTAQWLVRERRVDPKRLGIMGISLGGHVAALAWAVDPQFAAGCTVLAGGNVHQLFWNESSETREIKEALRKQGMTVEKLAELTKPYDPLTYASPKRKDGLLMIGAKDDPVVPIRNVRALRDAFGKPRLIVYPGDHYSVAFQMGNILDDVSKHFREELAGK